MIDIQVNGKRARGLIDTGCSHTIIRSDLAVGFKGPSKVKTFNGQVIQCIGSVHVSIDVRGTSIRTNAIGAKCLL